MENPTVQDIFHSFYLKYLDRYTPSAEQAKSFTLYYELQDWILWHKCQCL